MSESNAECAWLPLTGPLTLPAGEVQAVRVPLTASPARLQRWRQILTDEERARADRYRMPHLQAHFVICRGTLRELLAECTASLPSELRFTFGPHGKPELRRLSGQPLAEFSVSHSGDWAVIAFSPTGTLGIDIEELDFRRPMADLARRYFSSHEFTEFQRLPESLRGAAFYRGWTCKEAYIKALGLGLACPLDSFTVSLNPADPPALLDHESDSTAASRWQYHPLPNTPGFAAALISDQPGQRMRYWHRSHGD